MRLSKNERIRQHNKVYGKTFTFKVELHNRDPFDLTVKVTKLVRKDRNDRMYVRCYGSAPRRDVVMTYLYEPFQFFGYVAWTRFGPIFSRRGKWPSFVDENGSKVRTQIVEGCEFILLETTILEESNEQDTKT
jgi:hypothetical protein